MSIKKIKKNLIYLGLLGAFISPISALSYFSIFLHRLTLNNKDLFLLFSLIYFLIMKLIISTADFFQSLNFIRFYFGFIVFYLIFRSLKLSLEKFFIIFIVAIFVEVILINFFIDPRMMPNFPSGASFSHFSDGYQRPYSFAGNASVASTLLVVLALIYAKNLFQNILVFIGVVIFSSGAGMVAYLLSLVRRISLLSGVMAVFLLLLTIFFYDLPIIANKFNVNYINFLIYFKLDQINDAVGDYSTFYLMVGSVDKALIGGYGSDFGWLYFFQGFGIIGLIFIFWLVFLSINRKNALPVLILLVLTFHYPVIFFLAGQIIFAFILNYGRRPPVSA